jgi:hypothetical protein
LAEQQIVLAESPIRGRERGGVPMASSLSAIDPGILPEPAPFGFHSPGSPGARSAGTRKRLGRQGKGRSAAMATIPRNR